MNGCIDPQPHLSSDAPAGRADHHLPALRHIGEAEQPLVRLSAGLKGFCLFAFAVCLALNSPLPPSACAAASAARTLIESRNVQPYGYGIDYETAASVARALARLEALRKGAAVLGSDLAARIGTAQTGNVQSGSAQSGTSQSGTDQTGTGQTGTGQASRPSEDFTEEARMRALASVVFPVSLLPDLSFSSPAPAGEKSDEAAMVARILDSPRDRTQAVRSALRLPENLELRMLALERMEKAAQEGAALLQRSAANGERPDGSNPFAMRAASIGRNLEALEAYLLALRDFDQSWKKPDESIVLLEKLASMSPDQSLFRMGLGEALLLSERPYEALDALVVATRLPGAPPRAFYLRGVARLRLHLPAYAVDDFTQAIEARPDKAAWWRARGAARLLSGDETAMCPDFYQACMLGDCEGLAEVRKRGFCREALPSAPQNAMQHGPARTLPGKNPKGDAGKTLAPVPER